MKTAACFAMLAFTCIAGAAPVAGKTSAPAPPADPAAELAEVQMSMFDRDRNGKLTLLELQTGLATPEEKAHAAERFRLMDANGDGGVTRAELEQFVRQRVMPLPR